MTELRDYLTETQTEEDRSAEARTHIIREISSITRHMIDLRSAAELDACKALVELRNLSTAVDKTL